MKEFIFLYPISEIFDLEIKNNGWFEKGGIEIYRLKYKTMINKCIDLRYRKKGFNINYVIFNKSSLSNIIKLQESDKVIKIGLDFNTDHTKQKNEEYFNSNLDEILCKLNNFSILRIGGFHMWDCVEKLAKKAYELGFDTLVDEDLTEFFTERLRDLNFKLENYPTYNPRKDQISEFNSFIEARKEKPWLWQNY